MKKQDETCLVRDASPRFIEKIVAFRKGSFKPLFSINIIIVKSHCATIDIKSKQDFPRILIQTTKFNVKKKERAAERTDYRKITWTCLNGY